MLIDLQVEVPKGYELTGEFIYVTDCQVKE